MNSDYWKWRSSMVNSSIIYELTQKPHQSSFKTNSHTPLISDLNQLHIQVLPVNLWYGYQQKKHLQLALTSNYSFVQPSISNPDKTNKQQTKTDWISKIKMSLVFLPQWKLFSFPLNTNKCALLATFRYKWALQRKYFFSKVLANILTRLPHQDKLYGIPVADCDCDSSEL